MLQQNLQADENQDHTAGDLRLFLVPQTEPVAHHHAHAAEHKGGAADDADGRHNVHPQEREGNAHGQRVNAGGNGQQGQLAKAQRPCFFGLLVVALPHFPEHMPADEGQQAEGDPVVNAGDVLLKAAAQRPARQGHQGLKAAEKQGQQAGVPPVECSVHIQALAHRHRKGVHGKAHADQKQFCESHMYLLLFAWPPQAAPLGRRKKARVRRAAVHGL